MTETGLLAIVDGVVAFVLLASVAAKPRNRVPVLVVASLLLGIAGTLAVLALESPAEPPPPAPVQTGRTA